MTYPRLPGLDYRLTPENGGERWEWRHIKFVVRPPHRRLDRMRRYLLGPIGPPPHRMWRTYLDPANPDAVRDRVNAYGAVVRPPQGWSVLATLHDAAGDPDPHGAYLTLELQP